MIKIRFYSKTIIISLSHGLTILLKTSNCISKSPVYGFSDNGINGDFKNSKFKKLKIIFKVPKILFCSISIVLFFYSKTFSQAPDTVIVTYPDSLRPRLSYTINWDSRNSIIKEKRINIWGVNTGIIVGRKRNELTLGYYWLNFNSYLRLLDLRKQSAKRVNLDYYTKTDLYFFSLMYWKNLINNRKWLLSIPIEVGIGATKNQSIRFLDELQIWKRKDYFVPVQAGLYIGWKATRWVGLSVQGGYRYALVEKNVPSNFNGLYYSFGAYMRTDLFVDTYRWIFKKKRVIL